MRSDELEAAVSDAPIIGVLRGMDVAETVEGVARLLTSGIRILEVTIQHLAAVPALQAATRMCREHGALIGAGSVISLAHLEAAHSTGVDFTVAPGISLTVSSVAQQTGIVHVPGVATASEVTSAWAADIRLLKAFPAAHLSPDWIHAIAGPFPDVRFIATGGLHVDDLERWRSKTCLGLGVNATRIPVGWTLSDESATR